MIALRRIDHVCLRVADLDEAIGAGASSSATERASAHGRPRLPALRLRAVLARADRRRRAGPRPHRASSCARTARSTTRPRHLDAPRRRLRGRDDGALLLVDPEGYGIELMPFRDDDDRRPDVARTDRDAARLPAAQARPRQRADRRMARGDRDFYTDVLGMAITDCLGDDGVWLHINADHHVMALVGKTPRALPPPRVRLVDWGNAARRLRPPRPARPLARLGAGAPRLGQNICGYVRITEEPLFVELYCDMEQLERRPRAARLARRPPLLEHLGAAAAALVLPLRRGGRPLRAREPRDARREAPTPQEVPILMATTDRDHRPPAPASSSSTGCAGDAREIWLNGEKITHPLEHPAAGARPRSRWPGSSTSSTSTPTRCWRRRPTTAGWSTSPT